MKKFKNITFKILYPHPLIRIVSILIAIAGLVFVFKNHLENEFYAPVIYVVSFYALCVAVATAIPAIKRLRRFLYSNKFTFKYLSEADLRTRISMHSGVLINIGFALFKLIAGFYYHSNWFIATGLYYAVLSIIRFILIHQDRKTGKLENNQLLHQWKSYRLCGALLVVLNLAITIVVFRVILQNDGFDYPGLTIYASAAYTFYRFIMVLVKLIKKNGNNPILSAAKALDLSISLMALFSLQTAMFSSFGAETSETMQQLMNIFTGSAICLAVVCIAVIMILKSNKMLKSYTVQGVKK